MKDNCYKFCLNAYKNEYARSFRTLTKGYKDREVPESKLDDFDREPSIHAMQSFFGSVVFVLDGDFLRLPKFVSMINGGSEEFRENGWHGMLHISDLPLDLAV